MMSQKQTAFAITTQWVVIAFLGFRACTLHNPWKVLWNKSDLG